MNNSSRYQSKTEMLLLLTYPERRKLHWRRMHYWSRIRLHKKLVFATVAIGAALGLLVSLTTSPVYASTAVISTGACRHGVQFYDSWAGGSCYQCAEEALPGIVRLGRTLDDLAAALGVTNVPFERAASNLVTRNSQ